MNSFSAANGKANILAAHVLARADDTESPLLQQELRQVGQSIQAKVSLHWCNLILKSDGIVQYANELLTDLENQQKKKTFEEKLQELLQEVPKPPILLKDERDYVLNLNENEFENRLASAEISLERRIREKVDKALDELFDSAKKGDVKKVDEAAAQLKELLDDFKLIAKSLDPKQQQQTLQLIKDFETLIPQYVN